MSEPSAIPSIPPGIRDVALRLATEADVGFILDLRTNSSLNTFMSPVGPDLQKQRDWLHAYKKREAEGTEFYFVITFQSRPAGTIRVYDFQGRSFSWGSWIVQPGNPHYVALVSCILIYDFGFDSLNFEASHFEVRRENKAVVRFHQRIGASLVRSDDTDSYFRIEKADYQKMRPRLLALARM
jgi:RimJ/RimL family protein N-acetyltransferase